VCGARRVGPRLVWAFELGEDPSERSLPGDVRLGGVDKDRHQQRRDTLAAGDSDQTAQLVSEDSWSMCREPVGQFGIRDRLGLGLLGAVSRDGRVASRHGLRVELHALVVRCASHHAAIVICVRREEKCNV
jgi:hypothetical protein